MTADRRCTAVFTIYERCRGAFLAALTAAALTLGTAPAAVAEGAPTFSVTENRTATPGALHGILAVMSFDNAGTNPRITDAVFSTTEYYSRHEIHDGIVYLQAMTDAGLNALASPPPSPFTVDVTVTMTNDEGQTASGTITFSTTYERVEPEPEPEAAAAPVFKLTDTWQARPGFQVNVSVQDAFDNPGTNPRFTDVAYSTMDYYEWTSARNDQIYINVKTEAALNSMASPPPSPGTVSVTVTMANDEGQTASGTVKLRTTYEQSSEPVPDPTFTQTEAMNAPPGERVFVYADNVFDNTGTRPKITGATFSTSEYYKVGHTRMGMLWLEVKTAEELNALAPSPPSPFTVDVTVTMANDEGKRASGTIGFRTTYERDTPTFSLTRTISAAPGETVVLAVGDVFDKAGTNPRFTSMSHTAAYLDSSSGISDTGAASELTVTMLTNAELNALASPPPATFTFEVDVAMANDQGLEASGTIAFETTYDDAPYKFRLVGNHVTKAAFIRCGSSGDWTRVRSGSRNVSCRQSAVQTKVGDDGATFDSTHDCPPQQPVRRIEYLGYYVGLSLRESLIVGCRAS